MAGPALALEELLRWNDETATHWQKFLAANPAAAGLPCDIYNTKSVLGFLRHIVVVELRYAERLAGEPVTAYDDVPAESTEQLFAVHQQSVAKYRMQLADATLDWEEPMEFNTLTAGKLTASRRKVFSHAMLHGIRHYAQLATHVRQHGFKPDWMMDILASRALK